MIAVGIFYFLFPIIIILLCRRFAWIDKVGPVLICYLFGAIAGNCGVMPDNAMKIQDPVSSGCVAIALPLLLFSMDVKAWLKTAGKAILSMTGATIIVVAVAGFGSIMILDTMPDSWKIAGLAIGVYTGGTPNMAAIKTALDVDPTTYVMLHTYDVLISFIYILFAITIAGKLLRCFLKPFQVDLSDPDAGSLGPDNEDITSFSGMAQKKAIKGLAISFGLSVAIVGISAGAAGFFPKSISTAVTILLITSLGIGASFIGPIRRLQKTYQLGMYFILVFCLVVGSMANIQELTRINPVLFGYIIFCISGTFVLHALFCRIFNIDADTFLITSVSAVCSPPFVPVVAQALGNRHIILSGLTTGIIGYAVGNYLGITFAFLFKAVSG